MTKICTSIEQSKKLIELGLDVNTGDMCYKCLGEDPYDLIVRPYSDWKEEYKGLLISGDANVLPAWSLPGLLNLIPHTGFDGIELNNYNDGKEIWTAIFHWKYELSPIRIADNPIDAIYEIIIYLLENKKI